MNGHPSRRGHYAHRVTLAILLVAVFAVRPGRANELHDAILERDVPRVRELLRTRPELLNGLDGNKLAPIHVAAQHGSPEIIGLLLDAGADMNRLANDQWRPIDCAINWLRDDNVAFLLAHGSGLDGTGDVRNTPLHRAAFYGAPKCADLLLDAGADLEAVNAEGEKPLHLAIRRHEEDARALLLVRGAECDIHCAVALGMTERVKELLAADPGAARALLHDKSTPLHWAADNNQVGTAALLLDAGAPINAVTDSGATPLHWAAGENAVEAIEFLLDRGADLKVVAETGTALHYAASRNAADAAAALIAAGADVNSRTADGRTPLHRAAWFGNEKVARLLIGHWAGVDAKRDTGETPLHMAAWAGRQNVIPVLLEFGADISARNNRGWTPLFWAAYRDHVPAVLALLDAGADVNATDNDGWTALHRAAEGGCADAARALLERGADPAVRARDGRTPLHWAAAKGDARIAALLLDAAARRVAGVRETPFPNVSWDGRTDVMQARVTLMPPYVGAQPDGALPPNAPEGYLTLNYAVSSLCGQAGARWNWNASMQNAGVRTFGKQVKPQIDNLPLRDALTALLDPEGLTIEGVDGQIVLVRKGEETTGPEETPLHCAAIGGSIDVCELLVAAGADVNAKDPAGKTPAMVAADYEQGDVVDWLVAHGADPPPAPKPKPTPAPGRRVAATGLRARVTLTPPYPQKWLAPGATERRLGVGYAVHAVCEQAGLKYDFAKSHANCGDAVGRFVTPDLKDVTCEEALRQILEPQGMAYVLQGDTIILRPE